MTKNCPFCAEEILIDAKKCKHCGEWIHVEIKKSAYSSFINKTKEFVKDKKDLYNFLKTNHLRTPTEENPVKIKDLTIYPDRLLYCGKSFLIKEITWIAYIPFVRSFNFSKSYDLLFSCGVIEQQTKSPFTLTITDIVKKSVLGRGTNLTTKEFEQLQVFYYLISDQSYENRKFKMIEEIRKLGYLQYGDVQLLESGDIIKKGKFSCNLFEKLSEGLVSFGTRYKGLHSSSTDPYAFVIGNNNPIKGKLLGFEIGVKLKIEVIVNTDIFKFLIDTLIDTRKFP